MKPSRSSAGNAAPLGAPRTTNRPEPAPAAEDLRDPLGPAYRTAVIVLRPPVMAVTRRDWRGAEHLPPTGPGSSPAPTTSPTLDPFTFAHFLYDNGRPPRFLAKESVFRVPVLGRIVAGAGQIPVYRETGRRRQGLLGRGGGGARRGECVVVYPEATLTRDPGLWPMRGKTGAARIALTTGCPVIPIAQWGAQDILAPYGKRPHLLPRQTVHVWAGPPVDLSAFTGRPLDVPTLTGATDAILDAITGLLEQMRGEPRPAQRWDPRQHAQPLTGNPNRAPRRPGGGTSR